MVCLYKGHVNKKKCIAGTHAVMAQQSLNNFITVQDKFQFEYKYDMISEHLILKISDSVVVYSFTKHDQNMYM